MKAYIVNRDHATPYSNYTKLFAEIVSDIEDADVVLLSGGEDINPQLYGQPLKYSYEPNLQRDAQDIAAIDEAMYKEIPIVGICRGSQLLNVMCGGSLIQDVNFHTHWHTMITSDGEDMRVSSTHHQMMVPGEGSELLGWAEKQGTKFRDAFNDDITVEKEPEVVYYPEYKALCFQYHPETMPAGMAAVRYFHETIKEKLL